jgi:hypothetical protein
MKSARSTTPDKEVVEDCSQRIVPSSSPSGKLSLFLTNLILVKEPAGEFQKTRIFP